MVKRKIRAGAYLFPMPLVLIGANVNGKPNFETLAYIGMVESKPPLVAISSHENHYTNRGIRENGTFSVNTPSEGMVEVTDYCGINSGKELDKSEIFDVFYGDLKTAPMITHAPLNLECKVVKTINTKELVDLEVGHDFYIGKIEGAYADDYYLTEELPDITKLKPFVYSRNKYWKVGEFIENAFAIGKSYKKE